MRKDGTPGFDRLVTHARALEAVKVLMDYIAQRREAEATPNFDEAVSGVPPDEVAKLEKAADEAEVPLRKAKP